MTRCEAGAIDVACGPLRMRSCHLPAHQLGRLLPGSPLPPQGPGFEAWSPGSDSTSACGAARRWTQGAAVSNGEGGRAAVGRRCVRRRRRRKDNRPARSILSGPRGGSRSPGWPGFPRVAASGGGGETGSAGWGATGVSSPPAPGTCEVLSRSWTSTVTVQLPACRRGRSPPGPMSWAPGSHPRPQPSAARSLHRTRGWEGQAPRDGKRSPSLL